MRFKTLATLVAALLVVVLLGAGFVPSLSAQDDDPIIVGSTLSLTGFLAPTAIIHEITGRTYVDWLNDNGGLLGRQVEWVVLDDESSPDRAAQLYERLITEDEVDLVMGPYGTGNITSAMNVAERYGYVFPHHTASLTYVYSYEYHFPTWHIGRDTHISTNQFLIDALNSTDNPPQTVAVIVNQFPGSQFLAYGHDSLDPGGAVVIAEENGLEVVLEIEYPTNTTDFGPIASQIREADPDFVWVGALGLDGPRLIDAMEALDYSPPGMFYLWPAPGPLLNVGEPAEGAFSVTLFEEHEPFLSLPGADTLVSLFNEAAAEADLPYQKVEVQAATSWAAWQVLTAGVEGAGNLDQESIGDYLLTNEIETAIGALSFIPEEGNYGGDLTKVKQIQDGDWVTVWPPEFAAADVIYSAE